MPVEIQVRELDAKILLASVAAERGYPVILGSRAFIHFQASSVPRGVYLAKSMRRLSIRMFWILGDLGHDIVAWDEEALLRPPDEEYYRWRLSPLTMRYIAHLLAWGDDDARVLRAYSGYSGAPIHDAWGGTSPLWTRQRGQLANQLRTLSKRWNMRRPGHRNSIVYHAHRFPDISVAEVRDRVARFGRLLQRFERIDVEPFGEYTFRFSC